MKNIIKEEVSAGGVVFRRAKTDSVEFLIGKHSGYHKWVLPKGHLEEGESDRQAAVREVGEELEVAAKIVGDAPIKTIEYTFTADLDESGASTRTVKSYAEQGGSKTTIHKKVVFFLMEVESELGGTGWEMEERRWVSYKQGMELLAFETEKEVLSEAFEKIGGAPAEI